MLYLFIIIFNLVTSCENQKYHKSLTFDASSNKQLSILYRRKKKTKKQAVWLWFRENGRINIKPGQYMRKMNYYMSGSDYLATPHFPHSYHRIPDTTLSRQASQIIIILFSFKSVKGRCRDTKATQFIVSPFPPNLLVKPFINHSPSPGQPNQMTSKNERNKGDCFTSLTNDSIISIKTRS